MKNKQYEKKVLLSKLRTMNMRYKYSNTTSNNLNGHVMTNYIIFVSKMKNG